MKTALKERRSRSPVQGRACHLFGLILLLSGAGTALAQTSDDGVAGKTFVIGTDTTFAPFEFREGGELTGIDMDLIRAIAKEQGFDVEIRSLGFNAALQALSSNQVDGVIAGMSITDERKQVYDFSEPYFESGVQMAVDKNDDSIKGYEDLKGKTVVAKTGSEGESYAKSIAGQYGFTVKALDQSATMYESVKSGSAVAVFDDYPVLAYGIAQNNGLKTVTDKVPGGSYGFAVNKGKNTALLAAFNDGLAKLKADGNYQKILDKYLANPTAAVPTTFWDLLVKSFPALMSGLKNTLLVTLISFVVAMAIWPFGRVHEDLPQHRVARHRDHVCECLPRDPAAAVGLHVLLRHPAADRAADQHLGGRRADAVAELRCHMWPRSCAAPSSRWIPASSRRRVRWAWATESPCRRSWSRRRSRS